MHHSAVGKCTHAFFGCPPAVVALIKSDAVFRGIELRVAIANLGSIERIIGNSERSIVSANLCEAICIRRAKIQAAHAHKQRLPGFRFQLTPPRKCRLGEHYIVGSLIGQANNARWPMRAAQGMPNLKLFNQAHLRSAFGQMVRSRCADDTGSNHNNISHVLFVARLAFASLPHLLSVVINSIKAERCAASASARSNAAPTSMVRVTRSA